MYIMVCSLGPGLQDAMFDSSGNITTFQFREWSFLEKDKKASWGELDRKTNIYYQVFMALTHQWSASLEFISCP